METNSHIKMAALAFLFIIALYVFFVYSNLQSTFVQDIANNSKVMEEGFANQSVIEGFEDSGRDAKKVLENVETLVNQLDDSLHITKYRKDYEELVNKSDDLFELLKIHLLTGLKDIDLKKNIHDAVKIAHNLSVYEKTKPALESCLNYIEGK